MRVGVVCLLHESNTFVATPTTLADFERDHVLVGDDVRDFFSGAHHEVAGFFDQLELERIEAVPIFSARATPSGTIAADVFETLLDRMLRALGDAGPLDGLLLAPHGATVSARYPDADGEWISRVHQSVGANLPIICTIDAHANVSPAMVEASTALIAYRTNPHLDQHGRGCEAASLMARALRGEVRPTQASACPPMAINIERQRTDQSPCRELYALADQLRERPDVLSASIALGFPYADVTEMGTSMVVVTDDDASLATQLARALAQHAWDRRDAFAGEFISIDAALDQAANADGPVLLLDMGDNVGGGGPADGTLLAHALRQRRLGPAFACLHDPSAARDAVEAGVHASVRLAVGGKTSDLHGAPLEGEFTVRSLHSGKFTESSPRHGGWTDFDMGPTAIVESSDGLTVQITSRRVFPVSLAQLTSSGLDPAAFRAIVAKGVQAPIAAYEQVCKTIIRVNTPGVTCADMTQLSYRHRRRPMYPFEHDAKFTID